MLPSLMAILLLAPGEHAFMATFFLSHLDFLACLSGVNDGVGWVGAVVGVGWV